MTTIPLPSAIAKPAPLPSAMPRKANPLHQRLLGMLLETRKVSRTVKTLEPTEGGKPVVAETTVTREELKHPLAQNVSDLNVERAAARWM